ncbi:FAD:protein FMN transferase [Bifidobacterium simiiventris]|uniref:FAD:protein FMN transferase n=1 Tax=Bifidobacterium simiiventris TaxID=2834434 RepID=UPI001F2555F2|nr:FAD:protein FMN transferase [Bifidobacterium simiiventris]
MNTLCDRMPHTAAFPRALGTGLIIRSDEPVDRPRIAAFIDEYESVLSRFRADSTVTAMGRAEHGGKFDFPDWAGALFDLYDRLADATGDAIDPCVGEDLIRLGYDAAYSFTIADDANARLGAVHGRPTWRGDVERHGTTLITRRPVHLDFGACGKGYLVDLLAERLTHSPGQSVERLANRSDQTKRSPELLIDAGGDLTARPSQPVTIALEDPADATRAVGTAAISNGSCCASAPSRRHWQASGRLRLHHLLNAIDGRPSDSVAATWVTVAADAAPHPTALADGLATALFVADPNTLAGRFPFSCAVLRPDRTAVVSRGFPGELFVRPA